MRLEGIGFGFVIPIYFVNSGLTFDLDSLLTAAGILDRGPLPRAAAGGEGSFGLALGLQELGGRAVPLHLPPVFGATAHAAHRRERHDRDRAAARSARQVGASLIGAGMLSVLAYPLLAGALAKSGQWPAGPPADDESEI